MSMKKADKDLRVHVLDELDWAPNVDSPSNSVHGGAGPILCLRA